MGIKRHSLAVSTLYPWATSGPEVKWCKAIFHSISLRSLLPVAWSTTAHRGTGRFKASCVQWRDPNLIQPCLKSCQEWSQAHAVLLTCARAVCLWAWVSTGQIHNKDRVNSDMTKPALWPCFVYQYRYNPLLLSGPKRLQTGDAGRGWQCWAEWVPQDSPAPSWPDHREAERGDVKLASTQTQGPDSLHRALNHGSLTPQFRWSVIVTSVSWLLFNLGEDGEKAVCAFWIDLLASASSFVSGRGWSWAPLDFRKELWYVKVRMNFVINLNRA